MKDNQFLRINISQDGRSVEFTLIENPVVIKNNVSNKWFGTDQTKSISYQMPLQAFGSVSVLARTTTIAFLGEVLKRLERQMAILNSSIVIHGGRIVSDNNLSDELLGGK